MTDTVTLTQIRLFQGVWEGELSGVTGEPPVIDAWHQDLPIEGLEVTPVPGKTGRYAVQVPIPASVLTEGVQTVLLRAGDKVLAQVTFIAGVPLDEDLRAEIGLLRAELDLLKRAFRRHCAETSGQGQIS